MATEVNDVNSMHKTVQELQTTTHLILRRLNDMSSMAESSANKCQCCSESNLKVPILSLYATEAEDRVRRLEDSVNKKKTLTNQIRQQLNTLREDTQALNSVDENSEHIFATYTNTNNENADDNEKQIKSNKSTRAKDIETPVLKMPMETHTTTDINTDVAITAKLEKGDETDLVTAEHSKICEPESSNAIIEVVSDKTNIKPTSTRPSTSTPSESSENTDGIKLSNMADKSRKDAFKQANGTKRATVERTDVTVVDQKAKQYHPSPLIWDTMAAREQSFDDGPCCLIRSALCIDISYSMSVGDSWLQAKTFVDNYISGLEAMAENGLDKEHVALVTFGHETKILQRLTNDYSKIRQAFGNIKLGGPSPMYGGVMLSVAAITKPSDAGVIINDIHVNPKIIMITDGKPTDGRLYAGPDVGDVVEEESTRSSILTVMEKIPNFELELFCVPVGNANMEFVNLLVSVADGKMLQYSDGRKLSKRLWLSFHAKDYEYGLGLGLHYSDEISNDDKEQIQEIIKKNKIKGSTSKITDDDDDDNQYNESDCKTLPPVGSRVRRGPEWGCGDQDSGGPGTVIGHKRDSELWIEWDADERINVYKYGVGGFDVLLVDEPRIVKGSGCKIAVGCAVKPGKNWKEYTRTGSGFKGVVIKVLQESKKVEVRWNNRKRGDYSYGEDGVYEIELIKNTDSGPYSNHDGAAKESVTQKETSIIKNKNKNKNLYQTATKLHTTKQT